jgi:hypothetical protein
MSAPDFLEEDIRMPLIGEVRFRLVKRGGSLVPVRYVGGRSPRVGVATAVCVAVVVLLIGSILLLSAPRGLPLDASFHNKPLGHMIRYPKGWIAGYGEENVTHISFRAANDSRCYIRFWSGPREAFTTSVRTTDPPAAIASAVARECGFGIPAYSYRVRRVRFMQVPGIRIEGPVPAGWASLAIAFKGARAHALLMTAPSRLVDRQLAATWNCMIKGCRIADVSEEEQPPLWE